MVSRQDKYLLMLEHGLNVPDFVVNPSSKHKSDTMTFLKTVFYHCPHVTFLAKKDWKVREYDEEALRDAFQKSIVLEQSGYTVWIAEGINCEHTGTVRVRNDGSGKIKYTMAQSWKKFTFTDCEALEKIRDRMIIRRVARFVTEMQLQAVVMDFCWSKTFVGKLNERIVFLDYQEL